MPTADDVFLRRAIRLAMNGRGRVEPNPMVGCVLVKDDRIIGEGIHAFYGGPHAEPTALASCTESPAGATAYVTLEPCCHTNKQTPPCAPRLIEAKIARVVIGCLDPNPDVDGKGVAMLRADGIQVDLAPPEIHAEAKQLLAPFIARTKFGRPYVTMKWAQSANGLVAGALGKPVRITNAASDRVVHQLRARCDAIAVGTNTVLNDDPLLTTRGVENPRPLLRVILSNTLKLPLNSRLVTSAGEHPAVVFCAETALIEHAREADALRTAGVEIEPLPARDEGRFGFSDVLRNLNDRRVVHLLIEPGPTLARSLLSRGQTDRVWVFQSPNTIDAHGSAASRAPAVTYPSVGKRDVEGDTLTEYLNPKSDVFFSMVPSADLVST